MFMKNYTSSNIVKGANIRYGVKQSVLLASPIRKHHMKKQTAPPLKMTQFENRQFSCCPIGLLFLMPYYQDDKAARYGFN